MALAVWFVSAAVPLLFGYVFRRRAPLLLRNWVYEPLHLACPVHLTCQSPAASVINTGGSSVSLVDLMAAKCPSLCGTEACYWPTWYLANGHLATIFSAFADFTKVDQVEYERQYLRAPDGGTQALDFAPTFQQAPHDDRPVLLLLHGLTGGSHESYIRSVVTQAIKPVSQGGHGMRAVVMNFRGCGFPSFLTSPQLYHGGFTDDPRRVLLYLSQLLPQAPVVAMGFSLGANQLTKLLGEDKGDTSIKAAVSLSNPFNFYESHVQLASSWLRRIYSRAMAKNLRTLLKRHKKHFEHDERIFSLDQVFKNPNQTLYEFDNQVTSRLAGYRSVEEYYFTEASAHYVQSIQTPYLALNAHDDGIAPPDDHIIPFDAFRSNPYAILALTSHGGHLGYYEGLGAAWNKKRWLPMPALEFVSAVLQADPRPRHKTTHPRAEKKPDFGEDYVLDLKRPEIGFKMIQHADIVVGGEAPAKIEDQMAMGGL